MSETTSHVDESGGSSGEVAGPTRRRSDVHISHVLVEDGGPCSGRKVPTWRVNRNDLTSGSGSGQFEFDSIQVLQTRTDSNLDPNLV